MKKALRSTQRFFRVLKKTFLSLTQREEIILAILAVVIIASTYHLYTNHSNPTPDSNPVDSIPASGGAYSEGLVGQFKRLNPVFVEFNQVDRDLSNLIFSGLSKYDPIQRNVVEDIATHTLSVDKRIYTFTLKDNVKWHDGEPVTARDIYFTYHDVIQHPDFPNPVLKSNLQGIEINLVSNRTVEFKLEEPNSFFFTNTVIGLLPKHILAEVPIDELNKHEFNLSPIGTGPYQIVETPETNATTQAGHVYLTAFPDYYGEKPYIQDLRFFTFPDQETLLKNRKSLNGLAKITSEESMAEIKTDENFKFYPYSLPQYNAVFINNETPFLKNQKVRLGLLKAIDKESLINELGYKKRIDTPLLELNQEDWINRYDSKESMGALYDSGWRFPEGDLSQFRQNKEGEILTLRLIAREFTTNPVQSVEQKQVLDFLVDAWHRVGINILAEELSDQDFQTRLRARDYDLLVTGQGLGYNLDTYSYWHSSQAAENGLNLSNYKSPVADTLIETIRILFDQENKLHKLNKLGEAITEDIPAVFLYTPVYYYAVDQNVKNIELGKPSFPSDRLTNLPKWYIKEQSN